MTIEDKPKPHELLLVTGYEHWLDLTDYWFSCPIATCEHSESRFKASAFVRHTYGLIQKNYCKIHKKR